MTASASHVIGRVGGLAVALGVGAGIVATCAVAAADTVSTDLSGPSATGSATHSGAPRAAGASTARKQPSKSSTPSHAAPTSAARQSRAASPIARASRGALPHSDETVTPAIDIDGNHARLKTAVVPSAMRATTEAMALTAAETTVVTPSAMLPQPSALPILIAVVSSAFDLTLAVMRQIQIATFWGTTGTTTGSPTLVLNGYDVVPDSTELVTAFYGSWTNLPGGPTLIQGQQEFNLVDPDTDEIVGSFGALVSQGNPMTFGGTYSQLLVTSNNGMNVGVDAGEIPPVGSVIASNLVLGKFGWSYTAMPTESDDVVSFKILTPFGDIPIPMKFDAAKGIADHSVDNRPIDLGNGYSIAPVDPTGEVFTGVSGLLPIFTAVQGHQAFNIYDSDDNVVGTFEGLVTPTSDILGSYTQAILVTANDGINVGTGAGQVPPVGSVYNVMYENTDERSVIYTSLASLSGDVISLIQVHPDDVTNVRTFPLNILDASAPPAVVPLPAPNRQTFLATSDLIPSGVNGLPPRDVIVQGYRQFGVFDSDGIQLGSFNANVSTQWDMFGIRSQAILVTNVTEGTAGTASGEIPPVGSIFNYVYFGDTGLGTYYSVMPTSSTNPSSGYVTSYKLMTPLFDIPFFTRYNAAASLTDVTYYDPFI